MKYSTISYHLSIVKNINMQKIHNLKMSKLTAILSDDLFHSSVNLIVRMRASKCVVAKRCKIKFLVGWNRSNDFDQFAR